MINIPPVAILSAFFSFIVAFCATPIVIRLAKKFNLMDDPATNKHPKVIHKYPVPRAGGIAIFAGFFLVSLFFLPLDKHLIGILSGAILIVFIGILDDKFNLNPYLRLLLQLAAACIPIAFGIGTPFISNPMGGIIDLSHPQIQFMLLGKIRSVWIISDTLALLWIVFLMNMLNMGAKGVDGQLPGVVSIAALTIGLLSSKFSADITQWPIIILAAITFGSYLGFLPWNFYPQKIMPGYSGSTLAGYILALLSILSTTKVGTLLLVLGIPLFDTSYTILRRIASGKSPVWGDRGHLHHKLLDLGISKRNVTFIYWLFTGILGLFALNLNTSTKFYTIIGTALFVGGLLLWINFHLKKHRSLKQA